METHRKTLLNLLRERAYKKGKFTLSSGKESEHYINCKPVTLSCEGNALCSHLMIEHIEDNSVAVGGLTLGADPLVCGIAQKAYYSGNVTVLEDVTTTGSSAIKAVNVLRDAGYIVNRVVAIVDRQENHKVWKNNNIEFVSLFKLEDIIE